MVSVVCQIGLANDVFGAIRQGYVERVFCFLVYCIPKETVAGGWPAVFFCICVRSGCNLLLWVDSSNKHNQNLQHYS